MITRTSRVVLTLACTLLGFQSERSTAEEAWSAPAIEKAVVVLDGRNQEALSLDDLTAALAEADVVFLGEAHTDETTHRFELEVYERLLRLKEGRVVLALEMFDRDVQPALDQYLTDEISEEAFFAKARPWNNYAEAYRPLMLAAKKRGSPVVASNFPTPIRNKLAMGGREAMAALTDEERKLIPRELLANSAAYWKRVDNAVRGHVGMMDKASSPEDRLYSTQSLWDNAMGEACADALARHDGHMVLHINGGFHSAHWDGAVHQLRQRAPEADVRTVAIVPARNPATYRNVAAPSADYLALVEAAATNLEEGKRSVYVDRELSYLFYLPNQATPERPAPLLIWLSEDGLTAHEGMELCRQQFGDAAAIAVIEPPYKERQFDLAVGGRWYWADSFDGDIGALVGGVGDVWAYLLRHFPIDPERVCLAGEGPGATVAAATAVHTDRINVHAVAVAPRKYAKLKDLPLPLPEDFAPGKMPRRSLAVIGPPEIGDWWTAEVEAYGGVEVDAEWRPDADDPSEVERRRFNLVRQALGIPEKPAARDQKTRTLVLEASTPRARQWARLQSHWLEQSGGAPVTIVEPTNAGNDGERISLRIRPDAAARKGVLPTCPGPFGGTTVVVMPPETPASEAARWLALEQDDPLARNSRFHRVRIAVASGKGSLPDVLEKLQSENRRNVLIVPATFYASPVWLHSLYDSVAQFEDAMTLQWMPGLGGRKHAIAE